MKFQFMTAVGAAALSLVHGAPATLAAEPIIANLVTRQTGTTANEYINGGCADVIFFFARASTEVGNMGASVGPLLSDGLKSTLGSSTSVATQGIDYAALVITSLNPGGADYAGIATMHSLLVDAASSCPASKIVAGGYSQGAALTHRAIEDLDSAVMDKIVGVVTFGDTQRKQDGGRIPNFPEDKTLIICNEGDLVCDGTLVVLAPHYQYTGRVDEAVEFLVDKIEGA